MSETTPSEPVAGERIQSFEDFWPYYLGEHSHYLCRWVHFIGTTGFVLYFASLISQNPLRLGGTFLAVLALGALCFSIEAKRSTAPVLLIMIAGIGWAEPIALYGVVFAYFWAWVGHFLIEHNRPATFTYPLWSLAGDFRMWFDMVKGRRWRG